MAANNDNKTITDYLLTAGKLTAAQYEWLQSESFKQNIPVESLIANANLVTEEDLAKAKGQWLGVPYVDLTGIKILDKALRQVSEESAANYQFIPFAFDGRTLKVAMVDPADFKALEAAEFTAKKSLAQLEIYITNRRSFHQALKLYRRFESEVSAAIKEAEVKLDIGAEAGQEKLKNEAEIEKVVQEAPISKAVAVILRHAVEGRASDIHIEPEEKKTRVRYRVDGIMHTSLWLPRAVHESIIARIKILANLKIDEHRVPQDGRFNSRIEKKEIDFRVSTLPITGGEKIVLRVLDKSAGVADLKDLGFWDRRLAVIKETIKKPHGMFLMTGPTGSGKSTTLYSVLGILNKPEVNIVTLEDPVEYFIGGVNQTQIRPEVGLTFASGLRSILRQDPDVIMVGEIRDAETAEMAVHSSLTGHIVLSTLHTNTAAGAVPRLVDMGMEPFLLTSSLNAVGAQRLVRRLCLKCRRRVKAKPALAQQLKEDLAAIPVPERGGKSDWQHLEIYQAVGCKYCGNTGYQGRIAIVEVFPISSKMQEIILAKATIDHIAKQAQAEGHLSMRQDGLLKVLRGFTSLEEVLRVID